MEPVQPGGAPSSPAKVPPLGSPGPQIPASPAAKHRAETEADAVEFGDHMAAAPVPHHKRRKSLPEELLGADVRQLTWSLVRSLYQQPMPDDPSGGVMHNGLGGIAFSQPGPDPAGKTAAAGVGNGQARAQGLLAALKQQPDLDQRGAAPIQVHPTTYSTAADLLQLAGLGTGHPSTLSLMSVPGARGQEVLGGSRGTGMKPLQPDPMILAAGKPVQSNGTVARLLASAKAAKLRAAAPAAPAMPPTDATNKSRSSRAAAPGSGIRAAWAAGGSLQGDGAGLQAPVGGTLPPQQAPKVMTAAAPAPQMLAAAAGAAAAGNGAGGVGAGGRRRNKYHIKTYEYDPVTGERRLRSHRRISMDAPSSLAPDDSHHTGSGDREGSGSGDREGSGSGDREGSGSEDEEEGGSEDEEEGGSEDEEDSGSGSWASGSPDPSVELQTAAQDGASGCWVPNGNTGLGQHQRMEEGEVDSQWGQGKARRTSAGGVQQHNGPPANNGRNGEGSTASCGSSGAAGTQPGRHLARLPGANLSGASGGRAMGPQLGGREGAAGGVDRQQGAATGLLPAAAGGALPEPMGASLGALLRSSSSGRGSERLAEGAAAPLPPAAGVGMLLLSHPGSEPGLGALPGALHAAMLAAAANGSDPGQLAAGSGLQDADAWKDVFLQKMHQQFGSRGADGDALAQAAAAEAATGDGATEGAALDTEMDTGEPSPDQPPSSVHCAGVQAWGLLRDKLEAAGLRELVVQVGLSKAVQTVIQQAAVLAAEVRKLNKQAWVLPPLLAQLKQLCEAALDFEKLITLPLAVRADALQHVLWWIDEAAPVCCQATSCLTASATEAGALRLRGLAAPTAETAGRYASDLAQQLLEGSSATGHAPSRNRGENMVTILEVTPEGHLVPMEYGLLVKPHLQHLLSDTVGDLSSSSPPIYDVVCPATSNAGCLSSTAAISLSLQALSCCPHGHFLLPDGAAPPAAPAAEPGNARYRAAKAARRVLRMPREEFLAQFSQIVQQHPPLFLDPVKQARVETVRARVARACAQQGAASGRMSHVSMADLMHQLRCRNAGG